MEISSVATDETTEAGGLDKIFRNQGWHIKAISSSSKKICNFTIL